MTQPDLLRHSIAWSQSMLSQHIFAVDWACRDSCYSAIMARHNTQVSLVTTVGGMVVKPDNQNGIVLSGSFVHMVGGHRKIPMGFAMRWINSFKKSDEPSGPSQPSEIRFLELREEFVHQPYPRRSIQSATLVEDIRFLIGYVEEVETMLRHARQRAAHMDEMIDANDKLETEVRWKERALLLWNHVYTRGEASWVCKCPEIQAGSNIACHRCSTVKPGKT